MSILNNAEHQVCSGKKLSRKELVSLAAVDVNLLAEAADRIRSHFCGDTVELCAIINAKSGRCSENCRYCAQSSFFRVSIEEYPLLPEDQIVAEALSYAHNGAARFSIVTSGRKVTPRELAAVCRICERIKERSSLLLCASLGILSEPELRSLHRAGVTRYHHNLETSRRFFPEICTTHTYDDRLKTIDSARGAELEICSGGIIGLGETMEDRIDMALELRGRSVDSIPVNILNPIPGTPLADRAILIGDEVRKSIAIFRFILPRAQIRLAGGRRLFADRGRTFFQAGANAAITGPMLTTSGISLQDDVRIITELGLRKK